MRNDKGLKGAVSIGIVVACFFYFFASCVNGTHLGLALLNIIVFNVIYHIAIKKVFFD